MNGSYLQLTEELVERDACGEQMLLQNNVYGFLPMSRISIDEKEVYRYNITGRQALDVLLEHKQIDEQLLQELLIAISGVAERMENYLLTQECLLLLPEYIFRDYETGEFWFCYYPGSLPENEYTFQRLTEYLLTKIDHKEKQVVRLAYHIYEEALKEGYSLSGIRDGIDFSREPEEETEEKLSEICEDQINEKRDISEKGKCFEKIREQIFDRWKTLNALVFLKQIGIKKKKSVEVEPFVFEPEEEEIRVSHPTTLLMTKPDEAEGILKYIGNNQLSDFKIEEFPFLVGSDICCDAILEKKTISRMHARITKSENTYYIEDLNSSNGTKVEGEVLSYKEKVLLKSNMIIEFADEKFRFI